jgi:hypothetical protein
LKIVRVPWDHPYWIVYRFLRWRIYRPIVDIPSNIKYFIQRGIRGYSDRDVWDFNDYLAGVISGGTRKLAKDPIGHPVSLDSAEEWSNMLTRIASAFETFPKEIDLWVEDCKSMGPDNARAAEEVRMKKTEEGMLLFVKYFAAMWD